MVRISFVKKIFFIIPAVISLYGINLHPAYAQGINPFRDLKVENPDILNNSDYIDVIIKLENNRGRFFDKSNRIDYRSFYYQALSARYAFLNDYENALKYADSSGIIAPDGATGKIKNIFESDSVYLQTFSSFLNSFSDTVRSVFINEAHQISKHRITTTLLLQPLYDKGFRYLFLEGLSRDDIDMEVPMISRSPYIADPLYADMIRQAQKIGFRILPIDYTDSDNIIFTINTRDSLMAVNISRIYKSDPQAKILVHAGWAHIQERSTSSFNTMGNFYKKFIGIDPLTIDQTSVIEANSIPESKKSAEWIKNYNENIKEMSIFSNNRNDKEVFDFTFLFPPTKYINGRPYWMQMNGYRKFFPLSEKIETVLKDSCLVQAFYKDEFLRYESTAVPVDQVFMKSSAGKYFLALPEGEYLIRIVDSQKNVLGKFEENIKN